jgi:hypothetical protein
MMLPTTIDQALLRPVCMKSEYKKRTSMERNLRSTLHITGREIQSSVKIATAPSL